MFIFFSVFFNALGVGIFLNHAYRGERSGEITSPNSNKLCEAILYFVSIMAADWSFGNSVVQTSYFLTKIKHQIQ